MEALYHQTNRILQEITGSDLLRLERSRTPEEIKQSEDNIQQKLNIIHGLVDLILFNFFYKIF